MPFHLPALSRRKFLKGSLATGAGLLLPQPVFADEAKTDPHFWALFSDPHIAAKRDTVNKGVNMTDNLVSAVKDALAIEQRPAGLLVNGDLAFQTGTDGDYGTFIDLIKPLREAGIPMHLTLGNHDDREHFWTGLKAKPDAGGAVENKHVGTLAAERANWFLLDSLDVTNKTPGLLGQAQLDWLAKALDKEVGKPALIAVHHHPQSTVQKTPGITDTEALFKILTPRKQVKAIIFGHTHHWEVTERDGIHCVNLPTIAYPFNSKDPNGWVKLSLRPDGGTFELLALDTKHASHGEKKDLKWRT